MMAADLITPLSASDPKALGPYRLLGCRGHGGMGDVYLGKSPGGRLVAVKVIKPELATNPEFRMRFAREVANASNVNGLYTAGVVDADTNGSVLWLATQYIVGPSLAKVVEDTGPLPVDSLVPLAAGLAEALAAIHAARVVHRDLTPSNVLVAADGLRVIDFGISHAAEATRFTRPGGAAPGTPGFMSPEQEQGRLVGPASDVFSLGAVLVFAATGQSPSGDGLTTAVQYRAVNEPLALDRVPHELRPLLRRCLATDPAERPTARQLLVELAGYPIPDNWLPQTIVDMLPRYESAARILSPGTREPQRTATIAPAPRPRPGRRQPPPGHGRQRGTPNAPWAGRRGRVTAVAAAAAAVLLGTGMVLGDEVLAAHPGPISPTRAHSPGQASSAVCADETKHSGTPVHLEPTSTSSIINRLSYAYLVIGACRFYDHVEDGGDHWYMKVHTGNGGYGYIWVQYLVNGSQHDCFTSDGVKELIGTGDCPLSLYSA